jgi:diamine N-acetyltransferase
MTQQQTISFRKVTGTDTEAVQQLSVLATRIVKEHFDPIIGSAQNDYMISRFQTAAALTEQINHGYTYYIVCDGLANAGFIAFYPREGEMYLSKFYLDRTERGKGIAKAMLNFLVQETKKAGFSSIFLNVNRHNEAVKVYEHLGFRKIREEKNDIGNGYVMDDFVYQYTIPDVHGDSA